MIVALVNDFVVTQIVTIPDDDQTGMYSQLASSNQAVIDITNILPQPVVGWTFDGSKLNSNGVVSSWKITRVKFRQRFTPSELLAIFTAAATNMEIQILLSNQSVSECTDLSDPVLLMGMVYLVSQSLLTPQRMNQIMTTPPTAQEIYQG